MWMFSLEGSSSSSSSSRTIDFPVKATTQTINWTTKCDVSKPRLAVWRDFVLLCKSLRFDPPSWKKKAKTHQPLFDGEFRPQPLREQSFLISSRTRQKTFRRQNAFCSFQMVNRINWAASAETDKAEWMQMAESNSGSSQVWKIKNNGCFEFRYAAQVLLKMITNVMGALANYRRVSQHVYTTTFYHRCNKARIYKHLF